MRLQDWFRELGHDLWAVLWPTACMNCGAPDRDCCSRCLAVLRAPAPLRTPELGVPCFARASYDGPHRALLIAFKHDGRVRLAKELGAQLRGPLEAALRCVHGPAPPLLIPMPSRAARTRERGYRHIELLIRSAQRGRPDRAVVLRGLRARRGRRSQVGLAPRERARNARLVAVRRRARAAVRGRDVVLVDDVLTTGATLLAAQTVLERAGARVAAMAVLCVSEHGRGDAPEILS